MLDEMSLSDKAKVARSWFRKARQGQMSFTQGTAETFEQLLEAIEVEANLLQARLNIAQAHLTVQDFEAALQLPYAAAIAAAPNVVRLHPKPAKGTGR